MEEQKAAYLETYAPAIERGTILHATPVGRAYDPDFPDALPPGAAWDDDERTFRPRLAVIPRLARHGPPTPPAADGPR